MESPRAPADQEPSTGAEPVDAARLTATLGVRVESDGRQAPTLRFRQRVAFADGLSRVASLDLAARRLRCTLWAGEHRCLDHLELDEIERVTCDATAGRLVVDGSGVRLVLTRQGTLSVVPLTAAHARAQRRGRAPDVAG